MKISLAIIILAMIVVACNQSVNKGLLSLPGEVEADEYVINIDKDTLLVTKNGALLNIPKGSLTADGKTSVTLEVKEAYTMEQMIRSGLSTRSGEGLLSSGGMIYINAKGGEGVKITAPIKVALPTDNLQPGMQLYKGEEGKDGTVNWTNPDTLPENKQLQSIQAGKILYENKCGSCHVLGKEIVAPDLAHYLKRYSGDKLFVRGFFLHIPVYYSKTHDGISYPLDVIMRLEKTDPALWFNQQSYFCNLHRRYGGMVGTAFPDLDEEALNSIYQYVQNESDRRMLPVPSMELSNCIDSCAVYYEAIKYLDEKRTELSNREDSLEEDNGKMVEEIKQNRDTNFVSEQDTVSIPGTFEEKVSPANYNARYYQFTIETFGWYNIDILLKDKDGVKESELFVRLTGKYNKKVQVYLFLPAEKIYVQGGPAERNPEEFAFQYKSGKIMLPQGAKAYIMAVSESSSSVQWVLNEFTTGLKQEFSLSLQSTSKEVFNEALSRLPGAGIKISVKDAKNADTLRKIDLKLEEIEKELKKADGLKPKGCDCECGMEKV